MSNDNTNQSDKKSPDKYKITPEYIIKYLTERSKSDDTLITILGSPSTQPWKAKECGDGNINYIFMVEGCNGSVVVKQAPPYIRLVGPSWQLKQQRLNYEVNYMQNVLKYSSINAPQIYLIDNKQYLFVMENLLISNMVVFRTQISKGIGINEYPNMGKQVGSLVANMLYKTSDLYLSSVEKWKHLSFYCGNNEMVGITEQVIFEEPFYEAKQNRYQNNDKYRSLCPEMITTVTNMRNDNIVISTVYNLRRKFRNLHQALVHGDLHTGSIMCNCDRSVAIDAEFSYYGPMFVDVGLFIGNMLLSCFSQQLYANNDNNRKNYIKYLLNQTINFYNTFCTNFLNLWNNNNDNDNKGNLIPITIGNNDILNQYKKQFINEIWNDSILFAGIVIIRRCLGIADGPEFRIGDDRNKDRWSAEAKAVKFGHHILNGTVNIDKIESVVDAIHQYL